MVQDTCKHSNALIKCNGSVARGCHEKGAPKFELKLFGCKNVPYVGQINVRWWGKNIWGYKKLQGAKKLKKKPKKFGDFLFVLWTVKFLYFVGALKTSAGCAGCTEWKHGYVTPL